MKNFLILKHKKPPGEAAWRRLTCHSEFGKNQISDCRSYRDSNHGWDHSIPIGVVTHFAVSFAGYRINFPVFQNRPVVKAEKDYGSKL